jgi:hypothetical protein
MKKYGKNSPKRQSYFVKYRYARNPTSPKTVSRTFRSYRLDGRRLDYIIVYDGNIWILLQMSRLNKHASQINFQTSHKIFFIIVIFIF